jgi:hypothetical protein
MPSSLGRCRVTLAFLGSLLLGACQEAQPEQVAAQQPEPVSAEDPLERSPQTQGFHNESCGRQASSRTVGQTASAYRSAWAECMEELGYDIRASNGYIVRYSGFPRNVAETQTSQEPTEQPDSQQQPEPEPPYNPGVSERAATPTPTSSPTGGVASPRSGRRSLTPAEIDLARKIVIRCGIQWIAYRKEGVSSVAKRCVATAVTQGALYAFNLYICSHPESLARVEKYSVQLKDLILDQANCAS